MIRLVPLLAKTLMDASDICIPVHIVHPSIMTCRVHDPCQSLVTSEGALAPRRLEPRAGFAYSLQNLQLLLHSRALVQKNSRKNGLRPALPDREFPSYTARRLAAFALHNTSYKLATFGLWSLKSRPLLEAAGCCVHGDRNANQACQCDSKPVAMKKWLVQPRSAANR